MKLTPPNSSLERFVLVLGVASSACLAVAAFAAFGDSREAGWRHLNEIASSTRENVRAAWDAVTAGRLRRDGEWECVDAASEIVSWTAEESAERPEPMPTLAPLPHASLTVFDALMSESERAEISRGDLAEALSLAEEAALKEADEGSLAQARLRTIQLATKLGKPEIARAHWNVARERVDPKIVTRDTSTLLLCLLAALPSIEPPDRRDAVEPVLALWASDRLNLPSPPSRIQRTSLAFTLALDPREDVLRSMLTAAEPELANASFSELDRRRWREALRAMVGTLPTETRAESNRFLIHPAGGELLAMRRGGKGFEGHLLLKRMFSNALRDELRERRGLPDGFALDLDGDTDSLGEPVGAWIDLGPAFPRATVRHPDIESVLRRAESRTLWLRGGLLVLAVFVAGASATTAFALRRERRLVEARTSFVAGVSHELRTPLASILLMAENLENGRAGPNLERYHASIKREALRLRRLVDDVLDFSRLERGKRFEARIEDVDPAAWFDSVAAEAMASDVKRDDARGVVEISSTRGPLPDHGSFDREALRRAVLNLVDNALKHSGASSVRLHAETREPGLLALTVSDDGKGIPERHRAAVFDPFTRLPGSESTPGAGLGLAIVREIAVAHGGDASVRSPLDSLGVVVEIVIPLGASVPTRVETTP